MGAKTFTRPTDRVQDIRFSLGADPEFFFEKKGKTVGSEKIIPIKGGMKTSRQGKIIVDGVQAELNPQPNTCRESFASNIAGAFADLHQKIKDKPELAVAFKSTVKITKRELMSLAKSSRTFGCAPSKNINKKSEGSVKSVDPSKYMIRSAGGHIHLGFASYLPYLMQVPEEVVAVLDILVGNTCVLIDRDPNNAERRKTYGKAGEYRLPKHGLEYRTLSNFWLRSYQMMSFVMGMSRFAVNVVASSRPGMEFHKELRSMVSLASVHKAINTNDYKLALKNFNKIVPFLEQHASHYEPLNSTNIEDFRYFIEKGMDHWFKEEPMKHWVNVATARPAGWETFLQGTVRRARLADTKAASNSVKTI